MQPSINDFCFQRKCFNVAATFVFAAHMFQVFLMELKNKEKKQPDAETKSTIGGAVFNMTKSIAGAGFFAFPLAYQKVGFVACTTLIIIIIGLMMFSSYLFVKSGVKVKAYTAQDLMFYCFGKYGIVFVNLFSFLATYGFIVSYTVIIGDNAPAVLRSILQASDDTKLFGFNNFITDRRVLICLISFLFLLPLSLFRNISRLGKFSGFGLLNLIVIGIIILVAGVASNNVVGTGAEIFSVFKLSGLFSALGTLGFAYTSQQVFLFNAGSFFNLQLFD
jgi:sodium-coupled neutral amino acid transporter 11